MRYAVRIVREYSGVHPYFVIDVRPVSLLHLWFGTSWRRLRDVRGHARVFGQFVEAQEVANAILETGQLEAVVWQSV